MEPVTIPTKKPFDNATFIGMGRFRTRLGPEGPHRRQVAWPSSRAAKHIVRERSSTRTIYQTRRRCPYNLDPFSPTWFLIAIAFFPRVEIDLARVVLFAGY
jgi:hypothetical protein